MMSNNINIKGKLPPPRSPVARDMALNPPSGGGAHHTRDRDIQKGRSRKVKHPYKDIDGW